MLRTLLRALSGIALLSLGATAHEFWIVPASFTPEAGKVLEVRLMVGDYGRGENVPRSEQRIVRFVLAGREGEKPLVGRDGQEAAGLVRIDSEGSFLLAYQSNPAFVELAPEKFEGYLREKGLDDVLATRKERGESGKPAREIYSRCAKSILRVGNAKSEGIDRMLGLPLEIVPETDPAALVFGSEPAVASFRARLVFRGKPLQRALVGALCLDEVHEDARGTLTARTDADGRVALALPHGGRWLIAAVHMLPAGENPDRADWESFWASLTFETGGK